MHKTDKEADRKLHDMYFYKIWLKKIINIPSWRYRRELGAIYIVKAVLSN